MIDRFFRRRPHWYALVFHYGLGAVVTWQLIEDVLMGQGKVHSGEFYPWRRHVDVGFGLGDAFYPTIVTLEAVLLVLYFLRIRLRWTAALLALTLFVDNLGSFLNHRLLMSLELFLVSLVPVPERGSGIDPKGKGLYWNLDLIRWQLGVVYVFAGYHKLNGEYLSGVTLSNLFWMAREHAMMSYPEALFGLLQSPAICLLLSWLTVGLELALPIFLNLRKTVSWAVPVAIGMHLGFSAFMPFIWIFTFQMLFSMIVFLPDRIVEGGPYRLVRGVGGGGPILLPRLAWPGTITGVQDDSFEGWRVELPDGTSRAGFSAWIEVMSLSPLTFVLAEGLRAVAPRQ